MKMGRAVLLKSLIVLACLGAFMPVVAAEDIPTVDGATAAEVPSLKRLRGTLQTSVDPTELKSAIEAIGKQLLIPLTDLGESAQDALDAAVHVSALCELDNGSIIPSTRFASLHALSFMPADTPAEEAAAYYVWLTGIVYTTEVFAICNPNVAELTEGFVPYLRREETPKWLLDSARTLNLSGLVERVLASRKTVQLAYRTARIEKLKEELASRTQIPVLNDQHVFAKGTAVANGHCGWHSVFGFSGDTALKQLLDVVDDGTIYNDSYYEVIIRRLRDTQGESKLIGAIQTKLAAASENKADLDKAVRFIKVLNKKYQGDLAFHEEISPIPESLNTATTEELTAWLKNHRAEFEAWRAEKIKMVNEYEQERWAAQFNIIKNFKFSQDFLLRFIASDFFTIFEDGQLDVAQGETNYLKILQQLNLVNINVFVSQENGEPIFARRIRLSERYRNANVLLQGTLGEAGITVGHYDPLMLTVAELARVKRHEELVKLLGELNAAQAKASQAVSEIVVNSSTGDEATDAKEDETTA